MKQSLIRSAAFTFAAAALTLISAAAFAQATITLSDSNCSDFSLGGSPGARTLTCLVSAAPVCTVQGPSTATLNSPITLTANCSPAATSYTWSTPNSFGTGNCATSTTSTCQDTQTTAGTVNYVVKGTNAVGPGNPSAPLPVVWSNTVLPPSNCSISGAPSGSQTAGVQVILTINCSGGGAPTAWAWTGTGATGMTTQTTTPITVNATTTFTATASNAGGTSLPASATVTIGGSTIVCNGYSATLVESMTWSSNTVAYTYNTGGFAANGALVVPFTTPSYSTPPTGGKATIGSVEFSGPTADRQGALSTTACDFTTGITDQPGFSTVFNEIEPTLNFTVGYQKSGYFELQPNTTYYLNMRNPGGCSPGPNCDVKITLTNNLR